ncbi:flagellar protein FlhE [Salinicola halophyticus]|uniref:flagellar protein FlhE n=1 Tax=Salinicola halophyticus TaxID=1808881 RepID=UPI000DA1FE57|nr:flagellar protein FlhE [Salinicola halophyticus]
MALMAMLTMGWDVPAWAADGSWVVKIPRQTVVVSDRPMESEPIQPLTAMNGAEIARVRWTFRTSVSAPGLKLWLCQADRCQRLTRNRGETQHFSGRSAAAPFRLRFQWSPDSHHGTRLVISDAQLIVDYRQ